MACSPITIRGDGHTLYGAEVIVDPTCSIMELATNSMSSRRGLTESLQLRRIRAGSRLRGYHQCAATLKPEEYVTEVVEGIRHDPTLSFQLQEGFHVLAVVPHYLSDDPESLGYAAVIEWLNPQLVRPEHIAGRPTQFLRKNFPGRGGNNARKQQGQRQKAEAGTSTESPALRECCRGQGKT